jgi:hypothetical protein
MRLALWHIIVLATLALLSAPKLISESLLAQEQVESERKIVIRVAPQYPNMARSMNIRHGQGGRSGCAQRIDEVRRNQGRSSLVCSVCPERAARVEMGTLRSRNA